MIGAGLPCPRPTIIWVIEILLGPKKEKGHFSGLDLRKARKVIIKLLNIEPKPEIKTRPKYGSNPGLRPSPKYRYIQKT